MFTWPTCLQTLVLPEQVVLGEVAPVPAGLSGPQKVSRLQERQNVQGKLQMNENKFKLQRNENNV
jgi:hypothetical protein